MINKKFAVNKLSNENDYNKTINIERNLTQDEEKTLNSSTMIQISPLKQNEMNTINTDLINSSLDKTQTLEETLPKNHQSRSGHSQCLESSNTNYLEHTSINSHKNQENKPKPIANINPDQQGHNQPANVLTHQAIFHPTNEIPPNIIFENIH